MNTWIKQGVYGELQPEAAEGLRKVRKLYARFDCDVHITSIREGTHSPGSLHCDGRAWDMRPGVVPMGDVERVLGDDFDVMDHGFPTHRHIEYDPK